MTRPNFVEAEAIQRAVQWCEVTGGQLYIVHMSTAEGADIVRAAQARGVPVLAETCAQYLVLDDSVFEREDGHLFACCPQVKKPKDVERLWKGLRGGEVSVVSTDTCTFTREQKAMWNGDWTKIPMGLPGLETLLPLVYTRGVLGGRLTVEELSMKLSTNPARIMGLYPRKGAITVGADADLAIIHPTATRPVTPSAMETNADWSPYEGWELAGFARTTLSRGEVIVDQYAVVGREGRGQWLHRTTAGLEASRSPAPAPPSPDTPAVSPRTRAARPVGATRAIDARCCLAAAQMSRIVAVLPVPGPPVTIESRDANAASTAAHCSGAGMSSPVAPGDTPPAVAGTAGAGPGRRAGSRTGSSSRRRRIVSASSASSLAAEVARSGTGRQVEPSRSASVRTWMTAARVRPIE